MGEESRVKLHGMWASPFAKRIEVALKIKGIDYEPIEENLLNKSELLLKYNAVHKLVPVLVHEGKPIAESSIILEYIDETWNTSHPFLPRDPYERARVRFWAKYLDLQVLENLRSVLKAPADKQEKALETFYGYLKILEENMDEIFPEGSARAIDANSLGLLDIMMCSASRTNKAIEEALNLKLINPERHPKLYSWIEAVGEVPLVKELIAPHEKLVGFFQYFRQIALQAQKA
ncbi:Glutathione S-transferase, N-terminal [Dillenia turbinata]|uniref:Glutathione S-transferase n=1 Tax=Dillenia turbinata TaxID=194707 RepID=A0AAN8VCR0_9MAGN